MAPGGESHVTQGGDSGLSTLPGFRHVVFGGGVYACRQELHQDVPARGHRDVVGIFVGGQPDVGQRHVAPRMVYGQRTVGDVHVGQGEGLRALLGDGDVTGPLGSHRHGTDRRGDSQAVEHGNGQVVRGHRASGLGDAALDGQGHVAETAGVHRS